MIGKLQTIYWRIMKHKLTGRLNMNTVKHSKGLNLPPWQKKSFPFLINEYALQSFWRFVGTI